MTSQTTRIIRYSTQGFKPQYQSEHLKKINYHLNDFNINDFPEHLRYIIQKQHEEHFSFYKVKCLEKHRKIDGSKDFLYTKNCSFYE